MDTYQFLSTIEPFCQLPPKQLLKVSGYFTSRRFSTGDFLARQGKPIKYVGVIHSGLAKVTIQDHRGGELITKYLRPNDFLMDVVTLSGRWATAGVIAMQPTVCVLQTHHAFIDTLDKHANLKRFFYRHAVQGIRLNHGSGRCHDIQKPMGGSGGGSPPEPIRKALAFIDGHYHQTITLDMVAREAALSRSRLSRLFNEHVGQSSNGMSIASVSGSPRNFWPEADTM